MKMKATRCRSGAPTFKRVRDEHGNAIVHVPVRGAMRYCLTNPAATAFAILDADDFDRIHGEGHSLNWCMNSRSASTPFHSYVRVKVSGQGKRQVSHLVMLPPKGRSVRHKDGNPLNLRRSNLDTSGHGRTKGTLRDQAMADRAEAELYACTTPPIATIAGDHDHGITG